MPTKDYSFGTTEETIGREDSRTVLMIQNIHATNYLYVSDLKGGALNSGIRISPGGHITFKKASGEEPEKAYHVVASGADTTTRIFVDYGDYPSVDIRGIVPEAIPPSPIQPTPSCISSAILPFTPILNIFRHIRSYSPMKLIKFYYRIPYPKQHIWSHF